MAHIWGIDKYYFELTEKLKVNTFMVKMFYAFWNLALLLHLIACSWATASFLELFSDKNWIKQAGIEDYNLYSKYLVSWYWAVVTTTTVGYGDITPTNKFEQGLVVGIIIVGVIYYTYVLGNMSFLFSALEIDDTILQIRERQMKRIGNFYQIDKEVID